MIKLLPEGGSKVEQVKNIKEAWLQAMRTEETRFPRKARETLACGESRVARAQSMRWRTAGHAARQGLGLHPDCSEEPLEAWDGHAQACRRLQKITLKAL